jgi:hypothetical protein
LFVFVLAFSIPVYFISNSIALRIQKALKSGYTPYVGKGYIN